ncbi:MAG: hypothetical protein EBR01_09145 [Proteobacteria bacterium]|nr:hypothetical protein [Pseudomonadota bacterium]
MDRVKPATVTDLQNYFTLELKSVLDKHKVPARDASVIYLASLLSRHIESEKFFGVGPDGKLADTLLTDLYAQYLKAQTEEKKIILRRLGDICLMISGYFAESIRGKIVDLGYYFGMGGTAYSNLAHLVIEAEPKETFDELSAKFESFSNVLGEMSERSGLQSNKDVLRLYERWIVTGSDRLRSLLTDKGIPVPVKTSLKSSQ